MPTASGVQHQVVGVAALRPHPQNYNRHDDGQIADLRASLREFGQVRSIVVQATDDGSQESGYLIVAGHGLVLAARAEGLAELRADVIPASWPRAKVLAYLAADNELARRGNPDEAQLAALVAQVAQEATAGLAALAAGSAARMAELLKVAQAGAAGEDPGPQVDKAAELREKWQVQPGQLWALGVHRLVCGDCTDKATVERVMGEEKAQVVVTDPPYGMGHKSGMDGLFGTCEIIGDESTEVRDKALAIAGDIACVVFGRWSISPPKGTRTALIWDKGDALGMGALDLPWKPTHEMIFIVGKGYSGERSGGVLRYQSIGPYQQARGERYHPTQKPIPLIVSLLEKSPIGIVYDPFLGSGTTLIACEKLGRRCRAVEISPAYVSVALERWSTMTGQTPTRLGAGGAGGA